MELIMKPCGIACYEKIFEFTVPAEQAVETVIPDTMPDVERILCAEGMAVIRGKDVQDGMVSLTASVSTTVVYAPEGESGVCHVSAVIPISVERDAPGVTSESIPVVSLTVSSVEARMLNPRKLLIRATVMVHMECYMRSEAVFCSELEGAEAGEVEVLSKECTISPVVCVKEKTFIVADEYHIPAGSPELEEMVWHGVDLTQGAVRTVGNKLIFSGTVRIGILYVSSETHELATANFETEYSQMIETDSELASPDGTIHTLLTAEYVDAGTLANGERGITVELHLVSQAVCSDNAKAVYISDCYSNRTDLALERKEQKECCVQRRTTLRETHRDCIPATPAAADICRIMCRTGEAICGDGTVKCPVNITVMYKGTDGCMYSISRRLTVESKVTLDEDESICFARACCAEHYASPGADGIDIRLGIDFELLIVRNFMVSQVTGLVSGETSDCASRHSIIVVRATGGDTLWGLAKKHNSTTKLICAINSLEDGESITGRVLLIPISK